MSGLIQQIGTKYSASNLSWLPVLLFLPARFVFAFLAQVLVAGLFTLLGSANAWRDAAGWWLVYSTITDVLCLLSLVWLTHSEGMTLFDLLGVKGTAILKQLAWTPIYLLAVAPGPILAFLISQAFYGSAPPPMFTVIDLPPAGEWYARLIWPVIWVVTEELVYLGYLLPRIESISSKKWVAIVVVIFFWGLQHLAIPWIADGTYLVWRFLSAAAAVVMFPIVFVLGRRRLIPLIAIHYLADLSTALIATGVIPYQ